MGTLVGKRPGKPKESRKLGKSVGEHPNCSGVISVTVPTNRQFLLLGAKGVTRDRKLLFISTPKFIQEFEGSKVD